MYNWSKLAKMLYVIVLKFWWLVKANIIHPASQKHIDKYISSSPHLGSQIDCLKALIFLFTKKKCKTYLRNYKFSAKNVNF